MCFMIQECSVLFTDYNTNYLIISIVGNQNQLGQVRGRGLVKVVHC
jgi:hypothetical protein